MITLPWYPKGTPCIVYAFGFSGALLVALTAFLAARAWWYPKRYRASLFVIAAIWAVAPSLWFWFEYHFMIDIVHIETTILDKYKYGVQLGTAIWAGVAVALAAYLSSDKFKNLDNPPETKEMPPATTT